MRSRRFALFLVFPLALAARPVRADDPPEKKWKEAAELSLVTANGNSKATTTSVKSRYEYAWSKLTLLELIGEALGASNANSVTAENYKANEKVTWKLVGKNYLYEKFGWDRDRFAGIQNRWDSSVGLGRLMIDLPHDKLTTELGGGYINEERKHAPRNDFASGRAYAKYLHQLSETANFTQDAEYIHNFDNRKAYRLNTETALIASMTTHLSLKASFQWKRNAVPPPGAVKDDTLTSVALIVNY
jgi:putative salt-induced outer membrane protein YdiY